MIMQTIETTIVVLPDGSIRVPPRPGLPPGEHRAVLLIESNASSVPKQQLRFKMLDWSAWPEGSTFSREELYDDDKR